MKAMVKLAAVVTLALVTTGCGRGVSVYDIPLPGGAALGDHPIHVTASFTNVLDLVPQSGVKVNDVPVGQVVKVELAPDGHSALCHPEEHLAGYVYTPHRYPRSVGGEISNAIHYGWSSMKIPNVKNAQWIIAPPSEDAW